MKRPFALLLSGVVLAAVAFCAFYFSATARDRAMLHSETPELAWLKQEFNLSDAEYQRVCQLHAAYLPNCEKNCRLIAEKKAELKRLLAQTNTVTPEIAQNLEESNQLRAQCHQRMLEHFFAVSRAMPPEQGKRYLAWVQEQTLLDHDGGMAKQHQSHAHE